MRLWYDHEGGKAAVDISEGLDAGKAYIRRYDEKKEYMIRSGEFPVCRRSYLGEEMPVPTYPPVDSEATIFVGMVEIDGVPCQHWLRDDGPGSKVNFFIENERLVPRRLTDVMVGEEGEAVPLMSYDFIGLELGIREDELGVFTLPPPYVHDECEFHVGGYGYLHVFHYWLRF